MVRKYVPKKSKPLCWTEDQMKLAIKTVTNGEKTVKAAALEFKIPRSTLILRVKGWKNRPAIGNAAPNQRGRKTQLDPAVEAQIVACLNALNKWGFGLSKSDVLDLVQEFVTKNGIKTIFKDNRPGDDWWLSFKMRYNLTLRIPERLEGSRSRQASDPFIIMDFFDKLVAVLIALDLLNKPECLWNCDETGVNSDPGSTKIVVKKGDAAKRQTGGSGRESTTVLACGNAAGKVLPPAIFHKGKQLWSNMMSSEEYPGTTYYVTENGWMTVKSFLCWFKNVFLNNITKGSPNVLIYDGHLSHVSVDLIQMAIDNNVTLLKLPPHTSHILQPLDVSVFRGLKSLWDKNVTEWTRHNIGKRLSKSEFSSILGKTWTKFDWESKLQSGFKKTGIYDAGHPEKVNRNAIPESNYHPEKLERFKLSMKGLQRSLTVPVESSSDTSTPVQGTLVEKPSDTAVAEEPKLPLNDISNSAGVGSGNGCSIEDLILKRIKPSEPKKIVRKRIDVAEIISTKEYASHLEAKTIKKEKIDEENGKERKKRGRKPKVQK